ncbi:MAG: hypothetical protein WCS42_21520, partial [Verrucomicrobiota bacterium]
MFFCFIVRCSVRPVAALFFRVFRVFRGLEKSVFICVMAGAARTFRISAFALAAAAGGPPLG